MAIRFYNSLSHRIEEFQPLTPGVVRMYNCGPTVYDYAHIGNFRAFLFADMLRRTLELAGHQVIQAMNLTDVGHMTDDQSADGSGQDKMAQAATRLKEAKKQGKLPPQSVANPDDPFQVAAYFIQAFLEDGRALGLKIVGEYDPEPSRTKMPRATDFIFAMQRLIGKLIERQHAYVASDGAVYFDVQSFPEYGRLSGNTLDKIRGGAGGRVLQEHQSAKKHPADFLLWKPDPSHLMKWDSPWGAGYPGWHIECSAMAQAILASEVIDLHTGGEDNIFPHHECEIAQSCCASGQEHFARYWLHTRFLLVEGQKMSKSKGNFFTVRDVLQGRVTGKPVDPAVLRYELIKAHYRSNMNFTVKGLEDSASAVRRLRDAAERWQMVHGASPLPEVASHPMVMRFQECLAEDLNISAALGELFAWLPQADRQPAESLAVLLKLDHVLGILPATAAHGSSSSPDDACAAEKCAAMDAARQAKDFTTADRLRQELMQAGYEVKTTKTGTTARRHLA